MSNTENKDFYAWSLEQGEVDDFEEIERLAEYGDQIWEKTWTGDVCTYRVWVFERGAFPALAGPFMGPGCDDTGAPGPENEGATYPDCTKDLHLWFGAMMRGWTYKWASEHRKDPEVKKARQMAKAANFGFPGGLGDKMFRLYALGTYGVDLTEKEAKDLKAAWFAAFPECGKPAQKSHRGLCTPCAAYVRTVYQPWGE